MMFAPGFFAAGFFAVGFFLDAAPSVERDYDFARQRCIATAEKHGHVVTRAAQICVRTTALSLIVQADERLLEPIATLAARSPPISLDDAPIEVKFVRPENVTLWIATPEKVLHLFFSKENPRFVCCPDKEIPHFCKVT